MCPRNSYGCINKIIGKYMNTINQSVMIKGLLFFNTFYRLGNTNSTSFETFYEFISTREVNLFEYADNLVADIKALEAFYSDLSGMSQFIEDDNILSLVHELSFNRFSRKKGGIYYTPEKVVRPILDRLFNDIDIVNNPYIKILDPACGCGNFLCCAYDKLYELYTKNSKELTDRYGNLWNERYIRSHILQNNLFGADIDCGALAITIERLSLINGSSYSFSNNIVLCDSLYKWEEVEYDDEKKHLSSFWHQKFDFIIGNPPYQNMQKSSTELKDYVKLNYTEVYNGQNDLYYYFIYRAIDRLKEGGKLCFIVPPYFIKSTYGVKLRNYIINNFDIQRIEDITGLKPFYKTQIHSCIFEGVRKNNRAINHPKKVQINGNQNILLANNYIWAIINNKIISVIEKLECLNKLGNHAFICKGMDTGLNECFLVNQSIIDQYNLEPDLLRPVTRSKDIGKYFLNKSQNNKMLYITSQTDLDKFPNSLRYLMQFDERLKLRWAYKKGLCNWYSISTPRNIKLFENKDMRLFVPYRSDTNRFALDDEASIGLTDTTVLFTKNELDIYYLAGILNSKLLSFYNFFLGKRKGDMFEFFSVPLSNFPFIKPEGRLYYALVDSIIRILNTSKSRDYTITEEIEHIQEYIDSIVFEIYKIDDRDIRTILNYLDNKKAYSNYL